jgi:PhnB protein
VTTQSPTATTPSYQRDGFHTVTPFLVVPSADRLLDFLKNTFEATELFNTGGSGDELYAEVKIGDSTLMISGPDGEEPSPAAMYVYVPDVDAVYKRALDGGASSKQEPQDESYGDRTARFTDPFGNDWRVATRLS